MEISNFTNTFKNLIESLPENTGQESLKLIVSELESFLRQISEADKVIVNQILNDFETSPEDPLFQEVGKLLRKFHDQLIMIREEIPQNLGKLANHDVAEMSGKLQQIIAMTDKAANTTLDKAEEVIGDLEQQNNAYTEVVDSLNALIKKNKLPAKTASTLQKTINQIQEFSEKNNDMQAKMTDILIAQDYQDLTGQLIQKMTNLLKVLEEELASLIMKFGELRSKDEKADEVALEGPLSEDDTKKSSQDDVDALLNQFGF